MSSHAYGYSLGNETTLAYWNSREKEHIKLSKWFRKELEPYLGKSLTIEVPNYQIKYVDSECMKVCLLNFVLMDSDKSSNRIPNTNPVDHMWMKIPIDMLDHFSPKRPFRIDGLVYKYTHGDSYGRPILNLAIKPSYVSQFTWHFISGQSFGAVPNFIIRQVFRLFS